MIDISETEPPLLPCSYLQYAVFLNHQAELSLERNDLDALAPLRFLNDDDDSEAASSWSGTSERAGRVFCRNLKPRNDSPPPPPSSS